MKTMRISFTDEIDGGRILYPIGRVRAASGWRAASGQSPQSQRDDALRALIDTASEFDADAIVGVGFEVDGGQNLDLSSIPLERVAATGIAVKLARA